RAFSDHTCRRHRLLDRGGTHDMIRAAVFDGAGKPLRLVELPRPVLEVGGAIVRGRLFTICGRDLHTVSGRRAGPTPCVLGHEIVGTIDELCGEVRDVQGQRLSTGDRVVWSVAASCGRCFYCTTSLPQKCESLRKYGHEKLTERGPF